jgi:hypothetical protein
VHSSIENSIAFNNSGVRGMENNPEIEMFSAMNQAMAMGYSYNYCGCVYPRTPPRKRTKNSTG